MVLAGAIRERDARRGSPVTRLAARRTVWAVGGLAAAIVAGIVVWPFLEPRFESEGRILRGVGPLVSVATDRRSVDARITGGFPWVPLEPLERSGAQPRTTPAWEILAAASRIRKDAEADPTPENRHALGVAHLVLGNLDEAVTVLRAVSGDSPPNATLLNDLGAALLARGELQARPDDLIEALSCIDKSLGVEQLIEGSPLQPCGRLGEAPSRRDRREGVGGLSESRTGARLGRRGATHDSKR